MQEAQEGPLGWRERERALRRELVRTKEARDILAKSTAWCAKETTKTPGRSSSSETCLRPNFRSWRGAACYESPVAVTTLGVSGCRVLGWLRIKH